jgi:signal transduction histidine kinase/ActR/RegA family two-component response regulator
MLQEAGLLAVIVSGVGQLVDEIEAGAGFALVTEESLVGADLADLAKWLEEQPEWSDFPFVLLTQRGGGLERNPSARRYLEVLGNVTFLERPFHPTTLVSLAQSALRGRRRQYDARARLEELNELAVDLEQRVEERTAEREAAMAQLHEAQKLETIGQLTGGVAHDFNNLLTPIIGVLDLLHRTYAEQDERAGRLISNALQAADRAKTLVQRLLGFARRQALQTQPVDLSRLLGGMRDLIASSIGPTIEIHLRCEPDLSPALADPNQLELAILNLCVNARDAMPDGGALTILAEEVAIGPRSNPKLKPGLYVQLSVIDAGCGMDAATLEHAVEPFYSTKEVGRGTGLGLSMVHGLAAQLGGGFSLSSEIGEGTRADLYLPVAEEKALRDEASSSLQMPSASRPLSILLVDDEPLVRVGTAEMMRDLGHQVREASGGFEALAILAEDGRFDVVVTDYKMPGMDGAELAGNVRKLRPDAAILLITGYTGTGEAVANLPCLSKPFGQIEIATALGRLFDANETVINFPSRKRPKSG